VPAVNLFAYLVVGITTGSIYGLAAVGLVLTYRTSGAFNFAHGAVAAAAAFLFYELHVTRGWPWPLAAATVVIGFAVVGGLLMEILTRRLVDVPQVVPVMLTVGMLLGIQGLLFLTFPNTSSNFPAFLPQSGFTLGGVIITWADVITIGLAAGATGGLWVFLRYARLGTQMRAVVENPDLLRLTGERAPRVRGLAWAIGTAFAAMTGMLLAPSLGLDATLLTLLVVQAFGAAALGRFGSLPLTYAGGLVVGVIGAYATKYLSDEGPPWSGLPTSVPFLTLVVVLLVVPARHFPAPIGTLRASVARASSLREPEGRRSAAAIGAVLALLALAPTFVGTYLPVWTSGLVMIAVFASLSLLVWGSGQISLGHAAFVAVGASTMGHLAGSHHWPWFLAVLGAGLVAVPLGALIAIPAIRVSGLYLALATLGFGVLMQNVVFPSSWMFGLDGTASAPRPEIGSSDRAYYYVVLAVVVACCAVLVAVYRSRLGRLLRALSEAPEMLETQGLTTRLTRLLVFCLSAFIAGVAGALAIGQTGSASGVGYGPLTSLTWLAVLTIAGTRMLRSAILAAAALAVVPGYVTSFTADKQTMVFGVVAMGAALFAAYRPVVERRLAAWQPSRPTRSPVFRPVGEVRS
jgi:branched-subunit amino acid ABC-type transport system permease component